MATKRAISVAELVAQLRFGDWVIKVGMIKRPHARRNFRHDAIKRISLQNASIDDGKLFIETVSRINGDERTVNESFALEELLVEHKVVNFKPIFTLTGVVNVQVGEGSDHRQARRRRALAVFQRQTEAARPAKAAQPSTKKRPTIRSAA